MTPSTDTRVSAGFTPGPWRIGNNRYILGKRNLDGSVARVVEFMPEHREEQKANARLIAAAPELYGQLDSAQTDLDLLRQAIEADDPKAELLIRVTDLWKRNEVALTKARAASS